MVTGVAQSTKPAMPAPCSSFEKLAGDTTIPMIKGAYARQVVITISVQLQGLGQNYICEAVMS